MILRTILPLALLAAGPALAERGSAERAIVSKTGAIYAETPEPDGTRLAGPHEILLSADCRAEIAGRGRGEWFWTGKGTTVRVKGYDVRFHGVPLLPMTRCVG